MVKSVLTYVLLVALGLIVGTIGASAHRAMPYLGIVLCIILVLAAALFARTWKSWEGIGAFAGSWFVMTFLYAQRGPGDSVLIALDGLGIALIAGGSVGILVAAFVPRQWLIGADHVSR